MDRTLLRERARVAVIILLPTAALFLLIALFPSFAILLSAMCCFGAVGCFLVLRFYDPEPEVATAINVELAPVEHHRPPPVQVVQTPPRQTAPAPTQTPPKPLPRPTPPGPAPIVYDYTWAPLVGGYGVEVDNTYLGVVPGKYADPSMAVNHYAKRYNLKPIDVIVQEMRHPQSQSKDKKYKLSAR
jgi:hypothetical protein